MRYFLLVIGIVAVVAGGFFNQYILSKLDIGMFGVTRDYYGRTTNQFIELEFLNNMALLGETTPLFRERIRNLFGVSANGLDQSTRRSETERILANGAKEQQVLMEVGVAVNTQAGAFSATDYELELQGYRPGGGDTFFNTVDIYLTAGSAMWVPVPMQFVKKFRAYKINDLPALSEEEGVALADYDKVEVAVFKNSQQSWETRVKDLFPDEFNNVQVIESLIQDVTKIADNLKDCDITISGYTSAAFKDDMSRLHNILHDTDFGELGVAFSGAQEFSSMLADSMALYIMDAEAKLFSRNGAEMSIADELEWIYRELKNNGVSDETAAEVIFIILTACAVEIPLAESGVSLDRSDLWKQYTTTTFTTTGEWLQFWNDEHDRSVYKQNIIKSWARWHSERMLHTYSPIALVARPPGDSRDGQITAKDKADLEGLLDFLLPMCVPYIDKRSIPDDPLNPESYPNLRTPVEYIQLDMDLVKSIYFAALGSHGAWKDNAGVMMIPPRNNNGRPLERGHIPAPNKEERQMYFDWASRKNFMTGQKMTLGLGGRNERIIEITKNDYYNGGPFDTDDGYDDWAPHASNNKYPLVEYAKFSIPALRDSQYITSINNILHGENPVIKEAWKHFVLELGTNNVASALQGFNAYILNRTLLLTELREVDVARYGEGNNTSRMFLYPFMTGGPLLWEAVNQFLTILQEAAPGTFDRNVVVYSMFWDYDASELARRFPSNDSAGTWTMAQSSADAGVSSEQDFLYSRKDSNDPIKWAAYWEAATESGGFNLTKIAPYLSSDLWHTEKEYVNIWAAFFNAYPLDCLKGGRGSIKGYSDEWYKNELTAEQRETQEKYSKNLEAIRWDCAGTQIVTDGGGSVVNEDGTLIQPMDRQDSIYPNGGFGTVTNPH